MFESWTISVGNSFWFILNLSGVFRGSVCGGEGLGKITSHLKLVRIMLETWNLVENFLVEKWQWRYNFPKIHQIFWPYNSSLMFSCWPKFHTNTMNGVAKIFAYKRLTRNLEIVNTPLWVLPSILRLRQVRDTEFGPNVSNKMLLNAPKCQDYGFYHFWVIKGKPTGGR